MTGFKLHYPPGFVDRAYLVFCGCCHCTSNYQLTVDLVALTPHSRSSHCHRPRGRGTSPAGASAPFELTDGPGFLEGSSPGGRVDDGIACSSRRPPRASGPVPPEGPAPYRPRGHESPAPQFTA